MAIISSDPSWWPLINSHIISSYFIVAASIGVIYDWVLAFGQEIELILKQRWSLMTVLYLTVRYVGLIYVGGCSDNTAKRCSLYMYFALYWIMWILIALLGVIMIARLHAMYQRSRNVLVLLVVVFVAINVANIVMLIINMRYISAVWIALKHFRELRQHSAGGIIGDCFTVLMKTHMSYFVSFLLLSPLFFANDARGSIFSNRAVLFWSTVLGPRLILGVREYHAQLMIDADAGPSMISIAFQDCYSMKFENEVTSDWNWNVPTVEEREHLRRLMTGVIMVKDVNSKPEAHLQDQPSFHFLLPI
ncbi:uncharacterized protein EDB93DRAFT_1107625 [Suillus bovinus]|uniref:uncharacterized protein n=1 Tax=Suillus bovinus TaxID=48563 RepID=UPI001B8693F9|nr:uncharacterized protein EDB93DRAFT_1107625 [Suillus bovinus]KAG2133244.1 hypothetical protein EDB93DRAFT_1107625 [Suillus bovinus]